MATLCFIPEGSGAADAVLSVFGRTGAVVAEPNDYLLSEIDNDSTAPGTDAASAMSGLATDIGQANLRITNLTSTDIANSSTAAGAKVTNALDALKTTGDTNTANIATNTANIATNTANIATNTTNIANKANALFGVRTVTGTTDTPTTADNNGVIRGNNAATITFTINSGVFSAGMMIGFFQEGAGKLAMSAGGGMTIRSEGGLLNTNAQYSYASLLFLTASLAVFVGSRS